MLRRLAWIPVLFAVACGSSSASAPPSAPPPPAASAPPTAAATPAGPTAQAEAQPSPEQSPRARVVSAEMVSKDQYYKRATLTFDNPSPYACTIASYKVTWPGGAKEITLESFNVPPGESRQRSVRVHSDDGALDKLTPEAARVDVHANCRR